MSGTLSGSEPRSTTRAGALYRLELDSIIYWGRAQCNDLLGLALNLQNKPTSQSTTTNPADSLPENAVDGDRTTFSHTNNGPDQWWRVDLEAIYCLKKITIINRVDGGGYRLAGAVVRAGLDPSDFSQNTQIGDAVTSSQATNGAVIDFIADPIVSARYVSVQKTTGILSLAEVMVEEIQDTEETSSVAGGVDFTLVANPARLGATGDNDATLAAYKSPTDIAAAVSFGRQLTTGGSNDNLPAGSSGFYDANLGCAARLLSLPQGDGIDRTGVFYGTAALNGMATTIRTVILRKDGTIHTRPVLRTQTASIGESVTLQMEDVDSPSTDYRWKHNANSVQEWDGMLSMTIGNVSKTNEGIYSCFIDGEEDQQLHGFMRLIVRECAAGMWGPSSCQNTCRRCYNVGICDDKTGTCICAPGFSGEYCQQVHGRHVFGQNASHTCSDSTDPHNDACRGRLFCLPDPYGCSCAAGYMGLDCMQECTEGKYGADCKQTCHCSSGDSCEKDTGECTGNCVPPYFGSNCQCSTDNGVLGLKVLSDDPHQLQVSWQPDACVSGYILEYALTNRGQCEEIESPQRVPLPGPVDGQTTSHVITGLISRSTYMVYIRPQYSSTEGPDVSTSETTLRDDNPSVSPVVVTSYDSASITLSWREVYCANYSVQYALTNKDGCETIYPLNFIQHCQCSGTNSTVIPNLLVNSIYEMRVRAFVDGSEGILAQVSVPTGTKEPSAPPQQVTVTSTAKRSLTFSWNQPACGSRGGIITGYTYTLSGPGSQLILDVSTAEQVEIDGLIPFTDYSFQVAANNSVGFGPYSGVVVQRTDEAEPTVPLNVVIQNVDDVSITLQWSEPDPPQGIISNYNVRYWRSGQSGNPTVINDVVQLMHDITGLDTNVTYLVQVQAETSVGAGPWSAEVTATTYVGVPGPIQNIHWTDRTDSTITLDWEPLIQPRGQIQRYVVRHRNLSRPHSQVKTSTAVDDYSRIEVESPPFVKENLEPGTKYEFRVAAENQLFIGPDTVLEVYTKPQSDLPAPPQPISNQEDTTDTTVTISITTAVSGDDFIESYVVHVKKTRSSSVTRRDVLIPSHFEDSPNDYIAAELPKGGVPDKFVVGDTKMYGGYYNAPLQTGAVYNIRVGSVSKGNESEAYVAFSDPLTVTVQESSSGPNIAAIVLGVLFSVLFVICVVAFILWKKRIAARPRETATEMVLSENPKTAINKRESQRRHMDNTDPVAYENVGILPSWASKLEIKRGNLIIDDEILGKGNFGEVRAGGVRIRGRVTKAAIKTMKGSVSESTRDDFLKEIQTMAAIEPHPNIVGLLGACMHEAILYVALEFLPNGNLRDYLRSTRPKQQGADGSQDDVSPLTSSNLLKFSLDVAKGMEHLSNTGIIHRDLAARNILLSEDLTAKVSDFGLSRGEDIYVQKSSTRIPVRWLAIESLTRRVYKSKSDVWSFGILLWEIVTYGSTPYPGIESKSLAQRLLDGYRMPKPDNCADEIYDVMLKCWQEQPSNRPSFRKLVEILEEISSKPDANVYVSATVYENFVIKHDFDDN
ncbi:angiopoietin-1 receptor-like [Patiria miniata]|uniref:receptor protein-tyrosine kinase n=1 Tax=Patiria miniata TaxID=46514 RepID=A0A914ASM1_PATMI|nr:angiopoietin-1 receptor-like [Patiria miniata]